LRSILDWTVGTTPDIVYNITAFTELAGDANPANDTVRTQTISKKYTGVSESFNKFEVYMLCQNTTNPMSTVTTIYYQIPKKSKVRLLIYDITGRTVRTLVDTEQVPGCYTVSWDGSDDTGRRGPSGIYFYRLNTGGYAATKKIVVIH